MIVYVVLKKLKITSHDGKMYVIENENDLRIDAIFKNRTHADKYIETLKNPSLWSIEEYDLQ